MGGLQLHQVLDFGDQKLPFLEHSRSIVPDLAQLLLELQSSPVVATLLSLFSFSLYSFLLVPSYLYTFRVFRLFNELQY